MTNRDRSDSADLPSTAQLCLQLGSLFEAEILVRLLMDRWKHPNAGDHEYASDLVERACEVLRNSIQGEQLIDTMPPDDMNFISAVWYAEWSWASTGFAEHESEALISWLATIRRTFPSCFCKAEELP